MHNLYTIKEKLQKKEKQKNILIILKIHLPIISTKNDSKIYKKDQRINEIFNLSLRKKI